MAVDWLKEIMFHRNFRGFSVGERFKFRPGLNVIAGDQGSGKSTLLWLINKPQPHYATLVTSAPQGWALKTKWFDFERSNPRVASPSPENPHTSQAFRSEMLAKSHGEANTTILSLVASMRDAVVLLDEPDSAMSVRGCRGVCETLLGLVENQQCQVFAACHNPIVLTFAKEVLSVEHRRWMTAEEFIHAA